MSKSTLIAKLFHAFDRIKLGKEIHSKFIDLENENRDLNQQVSSLFSANSELSWPLSFCRCKGQFEELDLSSDQTGEYTSTCKRCGKEVHEEEEDAVVELKATDYAALKAELNTAEELIGTVVQAAGKKDQTHALGVHLDDTGVAFLTASFVKRCRDWLAVNSGSNEGAAHVNDH